MPRNRSRPRRIEGKWYAPVGDLHQALDALERLYDFLPRYSCKADAPDDCAVCQARAVLVKNNRKDAAVNRETLIIGRDFAAELVQTLETADGCLQLVATGRKPIDLEQCRAEIGGTYDKLIALTDEEHNPETGL